MSETSLALRLPYNGEIQQNFGVDANTWKVLVEAVWPEAQATESVIMALSYCKARNLDPLKRVVHIVPVWNKAKGKMVDTVWPGIAEARTTASRTKSYAGRDITMFGPDITKEWTGDKGDKATVTFPEWAQVTVYRIVEGQRVAFAGPQAYWMETFASKKDGMPNAMWQKRPRGQLDKCAEAAALRAAFPEELGDEPIEADGPTIYQHADANTDPPPPAVQPPKRLSDRETPKETPASFEPPKAQQPSSGPKTDAEAQAELDQVCLEIVNAGYVVTCDDSYQNWGLEPLDGDLPTDEVAETCCILMSSFKGDKGIVKGKPAKALAGKWLQSTLRRAKELSAQLQPQG